MLTVFGKEKYVIIHGENAAEAEKAAAEQLALYLRKITGCEFPVRTDADAPCEPELIVGRTCREGVCYTLPFDRLGEEELRVFASGTRLIMLGGSPRATLYAVYEFLRTVGCEFYSEDAERVPVLDEIRVPENLSIAQSPAFEYRDIFQSCAYDADFSTKLRLNGEASSGVFGRRLDDRHGGGISYAGVQFVHTFDSFVPVDRYKDTHPEYFSLINGKRNTTKLYTQLCLTNEEVYRLVLAGVREWLAANKKATVVSVSQYDSFVTDCFCTCRECTEINEREGSAMGTLLHFVNRIADDIAQEYPNIAVDTLAYQHTVKPCKCELPRDNVIIRYCTGMCCAHGIGEKSTCNNTIIAQTNIKKWAEFCERIYIWDYTVNFAHYLCPFPNFDAVARNIKFYSENNVKGVFLQGMYQEGKSGTFGELRTYLAARLLWDPSLDARELTDDFISAYYGDGGVYVREYIRFLESALGTTDKCWFIIDPADMFAGLISDSDAARLNGLWASAKKATAGTDAYDRVCRSELQWRYYKYRAGADEFSGAEKESSYQKLLSDCTALGVLRLNEGTGIPKPS